MNHNTTQLARQLEEPAYGLPAWDAPITRADLDMDAVVDAAAALPAIAFEALASQVSVGVRPSLYRYSVRAASRAVADDDRRRCRAALGAALLAERDEMEPRELMVNFVPHHVAATRIIGSAVRSFEWAARRTSHDDVRETLRRFGHRTDITLDAFGWTEADTATGRWFQLEW